MSSEAEKPAARARFNARTSSSSSRTVVEISLAIHSPYIGQRGKATAASLVESAPTISSTRPFRCPRVSCPPNVGLCRGRFHKSDADDIPVVALVMHDNDDSERGADSDQHEPLLANGVLGIRHEERLVIFEHGARLLKGDAVLSEACSSFSAIPLEANGAHLSNVCTAYILRGARLAAGPIPRSRADRYRVTVNS